MSFTKEDMIAFATHVYNSIADSPGHEPTFEDLQEWVFSQANGSSFHEQMARSDRHNEIHNEIWDLRLHESKHFHTVAIDGSGLKMSFIVMRVETGWIYIDQNDFSKLFVPLILPQSGTV